MEIPFVPTKKKEKKDGEKWKRQSPNWIADS